jgi:hypothetical protein
MILSAFSVLEQSRSYLTFISKIVPSEWPDSSGLDDKANEPNNAIKKPTSGPVHGSSSDSQDDSSNGLAASLTPPAVDEPAQLESKPSYDDDQNVTNTRVLEVRCIGVGLLALITL